jgi:hypothetical protein
MGKIIKCVLTGGPCGGKSSAMHIIQSHFPALGWKVITIPEAATTIMTNGGKYPGLSEEKRDELLEFELIMVQFQLHFEQDFIRLAEMYANQGTNVLIVFDRGLLDIKAYVPMEIWSQILQAFQFTDEDILTRYDCIVHLATAAKAADSFYTTKNNAARLETVEEARQLDDAVFQCWQSHPTHLHIMNPPFQVNVDSFQEKLNHLIRALQQVCGEN